MIQEKDFLYRVPVKNALVTAPGKQVRNPEILVDLEGGEFMHGNILDANSTNKLIDQSVKDAIDNSIENGNYVTRDLLEAETSARTKSDEDLNTKIKAEQTRAGGQFAAKADRSDLVALWQNVNDSISSLRVGLSKKQDKITVNSVDITDIETADITKLRTIVINLIDALSTSGLIKQSLNIE